MITAQQKTILRANTVAKSLSHVGQEESPLWSNRGEYVDRCNLYVGNDPASEPAWCLARCCYDAGMSAVQMGLTFEDTLLLKSGYCPDEYDHAKRLGTAIDASAVLAGEAEVLPGDLMLEYMDSLGGYHHAETVIIAPSKNSPLFVCVGGNTVPDGYQGPSAHEGQGYGCFKRHRDASDKTGQGHNKYCFIRFV